MSHPTIHARTLVALPLLLGFAACSEPQSATPAMSSGSPATAGTPDEPRNEPPRDAMTDSSASKPSDLPAGEAVATFGAGCFWCTEAVLEQLDGVLDVRSGYMGGDVPDPTYEEVCTGRTGHAEVVQVRFDPARISYEELLGWFFKLHDPTTLNRQGADEGTQYRSVIFTHSEEQRLAAESVKRAAAKDFSKPIVTEISPASAYYPAEEYHQDYYRGNRRQGYCQFVIAPKLDKLGLVK